MDCGGSQSLNTHRIWGEPTDQGRSQPARPLTCHVQSDGVVNVAGKDGHLRATGVHRLVVGPLQPLPKPQLAGEAEHNRGIQDWMCMLD